jgi:hypothetical protein
LSGEMIHIFPTIANSSVECILAMVKWVIYGDTLAVGLNRDSGLQ